MFLLFGMFFISSSSIAQTISDIEFAYDSAGNRTNREIVYYQGGQKSAEVDHEEEDMDFEQGLNVYPNPASHCIFITLNEEVLEADKQIVILFDNLGKQVYQNTLLQEINQVDVSNLPDGTYILKLIYDNKQKEWIIIKN